MECKGRETKILVVRKQVSLCKMAKQVFTFWARKECIILSHWDNAVLQDNAMHHTVLPGSSCCRIKCEKELVPSSEPVPAHSGYSELIYTLYDKQSEAAVLTYIPSPQSPDLRKAIPAVQAVLLSRHYACWISLCFLKQGVIKLISASFP